MEKDELLGLIETEEANCVSTTSGELAEQRREALQYYYGQPYGNEVEGRSQVVTTEVKDAIEGILPALMAIFTSSDQIVRFDPQGPEDEVQAQNATDYVNYIFSRLNNGFVALYCLFKDALLLKNGYLKVYWENYEDSTQETYEGLSDVDFYLLSQDKELELVEKEETVSGGEIPGMGMNVPTMGMSPMMAGAGGMMGGPPMPMPQAEIKAVFKRTKNYGKVCVDPVPPEEVLISRETGNDLSKARFVQHRTKKTISEIRQMGFEIEDDIADDGEPELSLERVQRHIFDDSQATISDRTTQDPTIRKVWLKESYLFVDYDGDGIAEYRKVTQIGKTLLDNIIFDSLPVIGGTAIPMPHKHYGQSIHDVARDIQLSKSTVLRQLFDNAYVANNGRMEVLDGMVNMDDLLQSRPNGIVRTKVLGAIKRIDNPLLGAPFYQLLEYLDRIKQNRVGASDFPNAVDPDAINAKAAFVDAYKSAALERINLMARILAEGPVKALFWKILELVCKHQNKAQTVNLKGQWVRIDPREWKNRFNMTVTVGLGTGSQQAVMAGARMILEAQFTMLKMGLGDRVVTEQNLYQSAHKMAKSVFPKDADAMFTNPAVLGPRPPQPPPIEMLELQEKARKADMQQQHKERQLQAGMMSEEVDRQFQAWQQKFDAMTRDMEKQREEQRKSYEAQLKSATELAISRQESEGSRQEIAMKGAIDDFLQKQEAMFDRMHAVLESRLTPQNQPAAPE